MLCHAPKSSPPSEAELKDKREWRPGIIVTHSHSIPVAPSSSPSPPVPVKACRHVSFRQRTGLVPETLNALKRHLDERIPYASDDENSRHLALIEWRKLTDSQLKEYVAEFLQRDAKLRDLIIEGSKVYSLKESEDDIQQRGLELSRFMIEWWPDVTVEKTAKAIRWCID
ncbi:MAG: hypothetical protein M1831_005816 [Alyxoria varia]|nr:MAG: hypothetical protein M1831_005816 [Alyxoria varia]